MSRLLPSRTDPQPSDGDPRVVGVNSDDADDLIAALSSDTARALLTEMHEEPGTPSELSDRVDTTLQNTQYHIGKLEDADLVDVVDTVYSEKGREMNVYAPSDQPLVLFAGREAESTGLKTALTRLLGGIGALAAASAVAHAMLATDPPGIVPTVDDVDTADDDVGPAVAEEPEEEPTETPAPEETPVPEAEEVAERAAEDAEFYTTAADQVSALAEGTFSALPPGVVFFLGGLSVLLAVFAIQYLGSRYGWP
ncbi:Transcriptional regulator containing HTH domain,ArsR family [Halalkaliarchaeum sp. AArc-CO]|uniref:ArsR/SmtB family transcription factor n=1 Tax=Halalkaliarchaeum sp. AArc-CO TaxID=2866381 RepID=UPI00217E0F34|nr:helix-turn-helix domain-containing protein [Halalkaliarchaeum sp. AArc-CO]UWG50450.1 Transcriptional regulator containing HTH domain,ArsR family [Halalkaliarchaeum sp. AArc-CO]